MMLLVAKEKLSQPENHFMGQFGSKGGLKRLVPIRIDDASENPVSLSDKSDVSKVTVSAEHDERNDVLQDGIVASLSLDDRQ